MGGKRRGQCVTEKKILEFEGEIHIKQKKYSSSLFVCLFVFLILLVSNDFA